MDDSMIPDNSVTMVIKYKGRLFTKGIRLEDLSDDDKMVAALGELHGLYAAMRFTLCHRAAARDHKQTRELVKKSREVSKNGK